MRRCPDSVIRSALFRTRLPLAAALPVLATSGCAEAGGGEPDVVRTDSAGVEIVETEGTRWTAQTAWRPAPEPAVAIGVLEGPEEYQLFRVRDAGRLPGGRIVVANAGTSELRFYGPDGSYLFAAGGSGDGPGEFQRLSRVDVGRDSVWAFDAGNRRVSVFDAAGTFVRSFLLEPPAEAGYPSYAGRFSDGTLLATVSRVIGPDELSDAEVIRRPFTFLTYGPEGAPRDTVGTYPGGGSFIRLHDGGSLSVWTVPFDTRTAHAVAGDRLFLGPTDAFRIEVRDGGGRLLRSIRVPHEPRPVTPELREAFIEERVAEREDPEARREARENYEEIPFPERVPAFADLLADADGRVWAQEYPLPGEEGTRWTVFDPTGVRLGTVALPDGFEPLEVGEDAVLGRARDELDVERILLYPLEKPEAGS